MLEPIRAWWWRKLCRDEVGSNMKKNNKRSQLISNKFKGLKGGPFTNGFAAVLWPVPMALMGCWLAASDVFVTGV